MSNCSWMIDIYLFFQFPKMFMWAIILTTLYSNSETEINWSLIISIVDVIRLSSHIICLHPVKHLPLVTKRMIVSTCYVYFNDQMMDDLITFLQGMLLGDVCWVSLLLSELNFNFILKHVIYCDNKYNINVLNIITLSSISGMEKANTDTY